MLNPALLDDYMHRFYGYGSWNADLWFVGMEEGREQLEARLAAWDRTDKLADLREFQTAIGGGFWFREPPRLQRTWAELIRIALVSEGRATDLESVKRYQCDELGRRDGTTALLELLPLPSPSTSQWPYSSYGLSGLATRKEYRRLVLPARIEAIRKRIHEHKPAAVVFYSFTYRHEWTEIAGAPFLNCGHHDILDSDDTLFVVAPHPNAHGPTSADFEEIGARISLPSIESASNLAEVPQHGLVLLTRHWAIDEL